MRSLAVAPFVVFSIFLTAFIWQPAPAASAEQPRSRAVIIGVNAYYHIGKLEYCVADAKAVREQLLRGGQFGPADVILMTDDAEPANQPTYMNLKSRFENLASRPGGVDTLLVFFAGHGVIGDDGKGYLVPIDGTRQGGLELSDVRAWLAACKARNTLLILDCCHAGKGERAVGTIAPSLAVGEGVLVLASCTEKQQSYDVPERGQGAFSLFLAAGLSGKADADGDRVVTLGELSSYVQKEVSGWADRKNRAQTPVLLPDGAGRGVLLARIPPPTSTDVKVPEIKLPDEGLPDLTLPDVKGTALEKFGKVQKLLEDKRAEINQKSEWYGEGSEQMKALQAQEKALAEQHLAAAREAQAALKAELEAIDRAWAEGDCRGWKAAHPEMKKLAGARSEAQKKLGPLAFLLGEKELTLDLGGGVTMKLVLIPPGEFMMGSPAGEAERGDNETQHRVGITKPFYMGVTEVTQEQYEVVMGTNPSKFKGAKNPVEEVDWNDAQEFCRKLSAKTGRTVRLPTEAEWEYACRARATTAYCFGDGANQLGDYAWHSANSGNQTHPVGQKKPNAWGLYDMHGNVLEWCADWFGNYPTGAVDDPTGQTTGEFRVVRGGSWNNSPHYARSADRNYTTPTTAYNYYGFRVVVAGE